MNKTVSIILCTFNEVNHIEKSLDLIKKNLNNVQVIIVDDNSLDGTIEKLDQLKYKFSFELYVRKNERGLATAQKFGFSKAKGDYVGTIDVNSKDQPLYFKDLIDRLDKGYDIAVLSRYVPGGGDERVFIRSFTSLAINKVSKFFLRISFNDFTSGIFLMKRELLLETENIISGYAEWFIEFIYILDKKNFKIIELPYVQTKDDKLIKSKSYPNFVKFFYLGLKYFLRILLTLIRR